MSNLTADSVPVILLAFANDLEGHRYLRNLPEELRMLRETLGPAESGGRCQLRTLSERYTRRAEESPSCLP